MPYAFVLDVVASWEHYQHTTAPLLSPPPAGLIAHAAGPTDEGYRVIAIWESEETWERFRSERVTSAPAEFWSFSQPLVEPTFRWLQPQHVVIRGRTHQRRERSRP